MAVVSLNWTTAIENEIDTLCMAHTNGQGEVSLDLVKSDLEQWLISHPSALEANAKRVARLFVERGDRKRRPSKGGGQYGLFQPQTWIPIAKNERVWMEKATREHLILWGAIEDEEFAASATAHSEKSRWRAEILRNWNGTHRTLADVMRDVYGWAP